MQSNSKIVILCVKQADRIFRVRINLSTGVDNAENINMLDTHEQIGTTGRISPEAVHSVYRYRAV